VYRFLLRPRWLAAGLLTVLAVVVFSLLGRWQYHSARHVAAAVAQPTAADARPVTALVPDGAPLLARDVGRPVTVSGSFDARSQRLVPGAVRDGRVGSWVVTLLRPGAPTAAVLVLRGWLPAGAPAPAPPVGPVRVLGWLGAAADPGLAAGTLRVLPGYLPAVTPALLANQVAYRVGDGFVGQTDPGRGAPAGDLLPVGLPAGGVSWDWQNLGYAIQWAFFAAAAVGAFVFGARREAQRLTARSAGRSGLSELIR